MQTESAPGALDTAWLLAGGLHRLVARLRLGRRSGGRTDVRQGGDFDRPPETRTGISRDTAGVDEGAPVFYLLLTGGARV
jgi:hypothetical protein